MCEVSLAKRCLASLLLLSAVSHRDAGQREESFAELLGIENPVALTHDFEAPLGMLQAGKRPIDVLKPLLFAQDFDVLKAEQVGDFFRRVDLLRAAGQRREVEDINGGKLTDL